MKIILDTNILISALIKDSISRQIILLSANEFYYLRESLKEIEKYKSLILEKSGLSEQDCNKVLEKILERVILIENTEIEPFLKEAKRIMDKIDPKDTIFIAGALAKPDSVIWSDDAHLHQQNAVRVWKTTDIVKELK